MILPIPSRSQALLHWKGKRDGANSILFQLYQRRAKTYQSCLAWPSGFRQDIYPNMAEIEAKARGLIHSATIWTKQTAAANCVFLKNYLMRCFTAPAPKAFMGVLRGRPMMYIPKWSALTRSLSMTDLCRVYFLCTMRGQRCNNINAALSRSRLCERPRTSSK